MPDPEQRRLAAQALATDDRADAPAEIVRALADEDWRVRKEAALSAKASPRRAPVLDALLAALGDRDDVGLRNSAVEALVAIGPDAVPAAIRALRSLDADGRKLAVEVLGGVPDVRGTEALASALADLDPNVRQSAAEALGGSALAGDEARLAAVRALRAVLGHAARRDAMLTLAALGALGRIGVALEWASLAPLASDPLLRGAVLAACARSSDPACGDALADALLDDSAGHARAALAALAEWVGGAMDRGAPVHELGVRLKAGGAPSRIRALDDGNATHGPALVLLALLGDAEAAPAVVRGLLDPTRARAAERAAALLGDAALPALLAVGEREPPSRHAALLLVIPTLTSSLDDRALAVVRATLGHGDAEVAGAAAQVLGALGEGSDVERLALLATGEPGPAARSATTAIEALAERHREEALAAFDRLAGDPTKTVAGCGLLAALRGSPPRSFDYLARALGDGDPRARRAAVDALATLGGSPQATDAARTSARDSVATALADDDRHVQLAAIRALGVLRHAGPLSELVALASDAELVAAAVSALSDADADQALDVCARLVAREDPAIASAAVSALGRLGARGEDGLVRALVHPSDEIVRLALSELGRAPSAAALEHVGRSLDHPAWAVRRLAAEVLGAEGGDAATALLRARLERETDDTVREAIRFALAGPFGGAEPT